MAADLSDRLFDHAHPFHDPFINPLAASRKGVL